MSEAAAAAAEDDIPRVRDFPIQTMHARNWSADDWINATQPAPGWVLIEAPPVSKILKVAVGKESAQTTMAVIRKIGEEAYNHRTAGRQPMYYEVGDIVLVNGDAVTQYPEWRSHRLGITYYEHLLGKVDQTTLAPPSPEPSPGEEEASLPDVTAEPAPSLIAIP